MENETSATNGIDNFQKFSEDINKNNLILRKYVGCFHAKDKNKRKIFFDLETKNESNR
jgi:hypothetical protein